jgi:hypothetical protein
LPDLWTDLLPTTPGMSLLRPSTGTVRRPWTVGISGVK